VALSLALVGCAEEVGRPLVRADIFLFLERYAAL